MFRSIGGNRFLDFGGAEVNWRELNNPGVVFRGGETAESGLVLDVRKCQAGECWVIPYVKEIGGETNLRRLGYLEIPVGTPRRTMFRSSERALRAVVLFDDIRSEDPRCFGGHSGTYDGWKAIVAHRRVRASR